MKIIAVSDSHGRKEPIQFLTSTYADADLLIHCGDICLPKEYGKGFLIVSGNCDIPGYFPLSEIVEFEGHRILVTHGHMLFSSYEPNYHALARFAKRNECDVVFFGHTHIYCDAEIDGVRLLNPGSIRSSRDYTSPSYMEVELTENKITAKRIDYLQA